MSGDVRGLGEAGSRPALSVSPGCSITMCPGGPILVRGDVTVEAEDGEIYRSHRPVSAVCRCGATGRAPWCDGTHKMLRKRSSGAAQ